MKNKVITKRPTYAHPERGLALEAGIIAALVHFGIGVGQHSISGFVRKYLPWATRGEVYEKLDRMTEVGRVVLNRESRRAYPFYSLPKPPYAPHPAPATCCGGRHLQAGYSNTAR